jgi:polysaccharide export outer membrane protein
MLTNQKSSFLKNKNSFAHLRQFGLGGLPGTTVLICLSMVFGSCGSIKNLQYLQGSFDTAKLSKIDIPETRVQKGDILGITVYSDNPAATAAATTGNQTTILGNAASNNQASAPPGYMVDTRGNIQLFKLGILPVEGMTQKQLADTLAYLYVRDSLLRNPYIDVRFLNFKVTLLGEVNRPGSYSSPTDKISALEAVSLAGDITVYGRKDNVLVIREANGTRQFGYLDFSKPDVFLSPYFYLKQNDMIIVDVTKSKGTVNDAIAIRNLSIGLTIVSTLVVIYSILR